MQKRERPLGVSLYGWINLIVSSVITVVLISLMILNGSTLSMDRALSSIILFYIPVFGFVVSYLFLFGRRRARLALGAIGIFAIGLGAVSIIDFDIKSLLYGVISGSILLWYTRRANVIAYFEK